MQVPGPELCSGTLHLAALVLFSDFSDMYGGLKATTATAADGDAALAGIQALPALQTLHFDVDDVEWTSTPAALDFAFALWKGKPGMRVPNDGPLPSGLDAIGFQRRFELTLS